jgi:hypothetical protein
VHLLFEYFLLVNILTICVLTMRHSTDETAINRCMKSSACHVHMQKQFDLSPCMHFSIYGMYLELPSLLYMIDHGHYLCIPRDTCTRAIETSKMTRISNRLLWTYVYCFCCSILQVYKVYAQVYRRYMRLSRHSVQ